MTSTVTFASETGRQIKNVLLRSARVKAWVSALSGVTFMVAAPGLAVLAQTANAPLARETAMALFAIGVGCTFLAISARREISLLRSELLESNLPAWPHAVGNAAARPTSSKPGSVMIQGRAA